MAKTISDDKTNAEPPQIGVVLANLRRENGWTLADVSAKTGVSISTLSKVENNQTSPAYSVLTRLAEGLNVEFGELIGRTPERAAQGARAITRAHEGAFYSNEMGHYEALASEIAAKKLEPMIVQIPATKTSPSRVRSSHAGEEFVYVLEGQVVFEMEPYAPTILNQGDNVYFDGSSAHGFAAYGDAPAKILSIVHVTGGSANDSTQQFSPLFRQSETLGK